MSLQLNLLKYLYSLGTLHACACVRIPWLFKMIGTELSMNDLRK